MSFFTPTKNWEDIQSWTSENEIINLAWEKMIQSLQLFNPPSSIHPQLAFNQKNAGTSCQIRRKVLLRCGQACAAAPALPVGFNFTSGPFADMNQAAFEGWTQTRAPLVIKCLNEAANWHGSRQAERGPRHTKATRFLHPQRNS